MEEEVKVVEPVEEPKPVEEAPAAERPNPTPAIVGFVMSLVGLGFVCGFVTAIVGTILGIVSNIFLGKARNITQQPFRTFTKVGRIVAIVDIILGAIVFIIAMIVIIIGVIAAAATEVE